MRACTIYAGRVSHWNLRGGSSYRRLQHTTAASGNTRFLFQNKKTMMKRSGTGDKWKEDRNKKATRVGVLTNSAHERHTREADKQWTINRNDERIERENEPGSSNYDLERSGCNEGKDGSLRRPMKGTALHWQNNQLSRKVSKATGIRSTVSPRFESRFLRSVSKGLGIEQERQKQEPKVQQKEREREKERAKWEKDLGYFTQTPGKVFRSERSNVLLLFLSLWPHFVHQRTPQPCDPSGKGIDSCSVLCAITTTLEYKSTAPIKPTEMSSSRGAPRIEHSRWEEAAFNCGTKKIDRHDDCDFAASMFRGKLGV